MSRLRGKSSSFVAAIAAGALFLFVPGAFAGQYPDGAGGPFGTGPVHGPGSSHNPIIAPVAAPVVRDHRRRQFLPGHGTYCRFHFDPRTCIVRDHRTPPWVP